MVGRINNRQSSVQEKTFGLEADNCYLKITLTTLRPFPGNPGFPTATTEKENDGSCSFEYDFTLLIKKECVCENPNDKKESFKWEGQAQCNDVGTKATYNDFTATFWIRADGTCPPGSCKGKWEQDGVRFKKKIDQVGCERNPCKARTRSGRMDAKGMGREIMTEFRKRIRAEYGHRRAKCPSKDFSPSITYLFD